jgi:hypothetical protein
MVLVPVTGYAVDAAVLSGRAAELQAAVAQAAEVAADQIDIGQLRLNGELILDSAKVRGEAADALAAEVPDASLDSVTVAGPVVTISASEVVAPPMPLFGRSFTVSATVSARLASGYASPSNHLALPVSTFWSTASGISMFSSSSRQRLG